MDDPRPVDTTGHARYWFDDGSATEAVTRAVADAEGVSPLRVDAPLGDVVDTDLLDRLAAPPGDVSRNLAGRVVFPYRGHEVTVRVDGYVPVKPEVDRDLA